MHLQIPKSLFAAFAAGPRERLEAFCSDPSFAGKLDAKIVAGLGLEIPDLMFRLLPLAQSYAVAEFRVGAVAQGASGALYFGANLEIPRAPLGWTIHAEQSAVLDALVHGEKSIRRLAVTSAPCGHCRQFLHELAGADELEVLLEGQKPLPLEQLLPHAFGPADLGKSVALLSQGDLQIQGASKDITTPLMEALKMSYAPYTHSPSAVLLETAEGLRVAGPYVENAAYNPSLPPMVAALDRLRFHRATPAAIRKAVLIETLDPHITQVSNSREILKAAGSEVELIVINVQVK